jgi:protein required for attachment to host cells
MSTCFAIIDEARARVFSDTGVDEIELVNAMDTCHVFAQTIVGELVRAVDRPRVTRLVISSGSPRMLAELRDVSRNRYREDLIVDEIQRNLGDLSRSLIVKQFRQR